MLASILVPTDLSARSDMALRRAFRLAAQHGASITLCHVVDDAVLPDMRDDIRKSAEKSLTQFAHSADPTIPCSLDVSEGDPTTGIVARIEQGKPNLVVMGTHRKRAVLDRMCETTVQRIIRLSLCPVLMVAHDVDDDYQRVVAATDFSPGATAAINLAHHLAPLAEITPVHVFHVPYSNAQARDPEGGDALMRRFKTEATHEDAAWRDKIDLPATCGKTRLVQGSPAPVLHDSVKAVGATLIVAGAHGRAGQSRARLGSLVHALTRDPPCDVLIARPA